MFNIVMTYLAEDEEVRVVTETTGVTTHTPERVLSGAEILEISSWCGRSSSPRRSRAMRSGSSTHRGLAGRAVMRL